ncbi:hypothetical protein SFRURICE_012630 [Spodoptera frugiperda]|nr:hypothetical protein SFRURICE_012630 [Spodoptera frugiperda]
MIFPTINTCPNPLPYPYDVHSWAEYAFYFVTMFWRRISIFCQFPLHKQGTSCKNQPALDSGHRACHIVGPSCQYNAWEPKHPTIAPQHWISRAVQLYGMHNDQNLPPVDFYMKSLVYTDVIGRVSFEDNYAIKRIFSPRVNVIGIRKCVRACIRRREDHFEQNFAN